VVLDKDAGSWFIADSSPRGYDGVQNVRDEEQSLEQNDAHKEKRTPWTLREFGGKTVWDWLQLLVVPLMLALITVVFTWQQDARQQDFEKQRVDVEQKIENRRAEAERELAEQRAQDEALQAYLNQMSQLMLERKLLEAEEGDPVHTLAQARTSTVILRLDAEHNQSVTRFLIDSGLAEISKASARLLRGIALPHAKLSGAALTIADLSDADLSGANLRGAGLTLASLSDAYLRGADLSNANLDSADLSNANLDSADLSDAFLRNADLSSAVLIRANLSSADLNSADLSSADLNHADLSNANLFSANLSGASLRRANLSGANLRYANLRNDAPGITLDDAILSDANLKLEQQAASLKGATMPNGQKYEDWLKDKKAQGKNEKNE
jgi:uncharacterized protein YjbI with pentapeptide repeats